MQTTRTTIVIKEDLLIDLRLFVQRHNTTMSRVFDRGIRNVIEEKEEEDLARMYKGLMKMKGRGKDKDLKLAKKSADEILYGSPGAWDGSLRDTFNE